ncbi:MAG: hemolysin family protein, partial [Gemmatimonadota bacterium]
APRVADELPRITDREIRALVSPGNGEPEIEEHERRLIQRAFLLDQTSAYDVMTPRVDIFAWRDTLSLAEIARELRGVRYSRVPVYSGSVDKVTGVLYVRDAYQALVSGRRDVQLRDLVREPMFVAGSVTLEVLLLDFQSRRIHMGIVIDEFGGVDGLVTLEDILEELVGEIVDETDVAKDPIVRLGRNEILVDGGTDLREINHFFNSTFPLLEHRSLNGYLLDVLGRVPKPGEKLVREGVQIEVVDATEKHVLSVRLSRPAAQPPPVRPKDEATPEERRLTGGVKVSRRSSN